MELRIEQMQAPAPIVWNYEELKAEIEAKVKSYELAVYDDMKEAKADRAALNKLSKAINDERIRREKEWAAPFTTFKGQVKELTEIIDKASAAIDKQIKQDEQRQRDEKKAQIEAFWEANREGMAPDWLQLSQIFDQRWLNASAKGWDADIRRACLEITRNEESIKMQPAFAHEALQVFRETLNVPEALNEIRRLTAAKAAREKAEEEQRIKDEIARMRAQAAQEAQEGAKQAEADKIPTEEQKPVETPKNAKIWELSFRVWLDIDQAKALKAFFEAQGIKYEKI